MSSKFYYPELDALRFLAFITVFMHHGPVFAWIPGYQHLVEYGWIGVDLFLCLSAFLFVHLLRVEWDRTGTINVGFFYLRRALRIWPIYFIFVTIAILVSYSIQGFTDIGLLRAYGLFTFTDNLLTANYASYNILFWVPHLWTISYEEQFYAVIPWFLRFIFKRSRQNQFLTLGILFLVGFGFRAIFIALKVAHPAIWVLPITHFDSILFGLAVGLGLFDIIFRRIPTWVTALAGILGLYVCTLLPNVYFVDWSLMALYPLVGFSVALLVHSTLCAQQSPATAWLRWRPFAFLGKISYGLYLFHWVAIEYVENWVSQTFAGKNPHNQILLAFALALAVTILMGTISYIIIEKPFLKMKSRFTIVQSRPV